MRIFPSLLAAAVAFLPLVSSSAAVAGGVGTRDHMRNVRYGEIIVVTGGPIHFVGHVYNTIGLNDCPEAAWKALDLAQIKKQFHARAVLLNGPRYFMMDETSISHPGAVASFGPLDLRLLADLEITPRMLLRGKAEPYEASTVKRTTMYLYKAGREVYELVSPDGKVYVMQTYALIVDPKLTESQLATLGSKLKLPPGWHYRVRKLKADLVLQTKGIAYVLQDDLENSYQLSDLKP